MTKGADSELTGWQPKETASQLPEERGTLETAWVASVHKREGPQRPQCPKGRRPKDPSVAAPLAAAGCRGSCWRVVDVCSVCSFLMTFFTVQVLAQRNFDWNDTAACENDVCLPLLATHLSEQAATLHLTVAP